MEQLVENAKNGDKAAEQELFRELSVRFRCFAAHRVDTENAEEIAQQACITVLQKYKTETFTVSFQAWAYGVLKMTVRQFGRDKGRRADKKTALARDFEWPQASPSHPMLRQSLLDCIGRLARSFSKYARIVNLRYQGYSTEEICRRMVLKPEQYYVYVGRGRSMLRDCLAEKGVLS
ncbi:MAG: ECF-type sigma factor [candidate division Zixibacteria bacterium]|nr:ECF-type sigma factor [candidate division Zixibacteria bacterium]MDH3937237.1 ECF-type sigma factor [candidate division Zixibacteria bacterium]MDH4033364.1 ECF-type sigma factor [candidate division Zixibacteria bacterium]